MLQPILCLSLLLFVTATPASAGIDESKLVDLTYPLDERTVFWPSNKPFTWEKSSWGKTTQGYWYASAEFSMSEHGGTHIDAPIHFAEGRQSVDEIPLQKLIAPAVVIDVRPAVGEDRDYRLSRQDLEKWESRPRSDSARRGSPDADGLGAGVAGQIALPRKCDAIGSEDAAFSRLLKRSGGISRQGAPH